MVVFLRDAIFQVIKLCTPVLGVALVVGLIVAIFQATTSIQEQTLTFLPKMLAILAVLFFLGSWMFSSMEEYTIQLFRQIPNLAA